MRIIICHHLHCADQKGCLMIKQCSGTYMVQVDFFGSRILLSSKFVLIISINPSSCLQIHHPVHNPPKCIIQNVSKCFVLNGGSFISNVQKPDMVHPVHPVHRKACDHITVVQECHGITSCAAVAQAVWKLESHEINTT